MTDWLGSWLIRGLSALFCLMPQGLALAIGGAIGRLIPWIKPSRKVIGYRNLKVAFGREKTPKELRAILRGTCAHLGRMVVEILRLPLMDYRFADRNLPLRGSEFADEALSRGKGAIFLTAHFGNWELSSVAGAIKGYPTTVLAREQAKTPRMDRLLNQFRERTGCKVVMKGAPLRALIKALHANELVGILADQGGGLSGSVMVPLFGRLAPMPTGAFEIAAKTGATLLPVLIRRLEGGRHEIKISPPLKLATTPDGDVDLTRAARGYLEMLEHQVRRAPEQWLWLHNRWKRSPQHRAMVISDGRPGHLNQATALAEELKASLEAQGRQLEIEVVEVRFKSRWRNGLMFALGWLASTWWQGNPWAIRRCLVKDSYRKLVLTWCDWVISCGSSVAPVNLWTAKEHGARSLVIMRPKGQPLGRFDLAVVPAHDGIRRGDHTIVTTGALHRLTPAELDQAAAKLRREVGLSSKLYVSLLIGGEEERWRWLTRESLNRLLDELLIVTQAWEADILATTSRRTPAWAETIIEERLTASGRAPLIVIANRRNLEGVVPGMLGLSQAVVVTGESIMMISEACASAKPVIVIGGLGKPKHQRFVQLLAQEGFVRVARVEEVGDLLNQCWEHARDLRPLDDRAVVREALEKLVTR